MRLHKAGAWECCYIFLVIPRHFAIISLSSTVFCFKQSVIHLSPSLPAPPPQAICSEPTLCSSLCTAPTRWCLWATCSTRHARSRRRSTQRCGAQSDLRFCLHLVIIFIFFEVTRLFCCLLVVVVVFLLNLALFALWCHDAF